MTSSPPSLSSLHAEKDALHERFLSALHSLQHEESTYASAYPPQAPIHPKSASLQLHFDRTLSLLTDRLHRMAPPSEEQQNPSSEPLPHSHDKPFPASPHVSPPSSPPTPPSVPIALHSSASLDLLASTLAAERAARLHSLQSQQLDDEEAERVLAHLRTHQRRIEERERVDTSHQKSLSALESAHRQDQLTLLVTRAELELERRRRTDREREEKETLRQKTEDQSARKEVMEERWTERERLMREELRSRISQWEEELTEKEGQWRGELQRVTALLQKEREGRQLERRHGDEERREMKRLYEVQVGKLTRQMQEEREQLIRQRKAEQAKGEEERKKRADEEGEERRGREREREERRMERERAERELQAMEKKLKEVSERVSAMTRGEEQREEETRKATDRIDQLQQEFSTSAHHHTDNPHVQ